MAIFTPTNDNEYIPVPSDTFIIKGGNEENGYDSEYLAVVNFTNMADVVMAVNLHPPARVCDFSLTEMSRKKLSFVRTGTIADSV